MFTFVTHEKTNKRNIYRIKNIALKDQRNLLAAKKELMLSCNLVFFSHLYSHNWLRG